MATSEGDSNTDSDLAPTRLTDRSLAPDLARGLMLLLIAVAHAPAFVGDWARGPAFFNTAAELIRSLIAENMARAMFTFLFGYGLGQLVHRRRVRHGDWSALRRLLRRRAVWLIIIGFAHEVLLVPFDILVVYGLTLLVLAPLVLARDEVLWWCSALALLPATALVAWQGVVAQTAAAAGDPITLAQWMTLDQATRVLTQLPSWPVETAVSTVVVVPGMLVGVWAARRKILDEPEHHASSLRRATALLLGVALVGRLPMALLVTGAWTATSVSAVWPQPPHTPCPDTSAASGWPPPSHSSRPGSAPDASPRPWRRWASAR